MSHKTAATVARRVASEETSRLSGPCRLQVDDELEFGRLHDRQVGRLCAFEDLTGVTPNVTIHLQIIGPIAHQPRRLQLARERYRSRVSHSAPRASQTGRGG